MFHVMDGLRARIRQRLDGIGKAARRASLDGGLSEYTISKILERADHSPTLGTIDKLAKGLDTTAPWLAYGLTVDGLPAMAAEDGQISINADLLKKALEFVLVHEGVEERRAALLADILPEALAGPPIEAVDGDPLLSFRVHLQFEEQRSAFRSS